MMKIYQLVQMAEENKRRRKIVNYVGTNEEGKNIL